MGAAMTEHAYKPGDRVRRPTHRHHTATLIRQDTEAGRFPDRWLLLDEQDDTLDQWSSAFFEPIDSEVPQELEEGERVKHDVHGLGTVASLTERHKVDGTAVVDFESDELTLHTCGVHLLTKVEPEPEVSEEFATLHGCIYDALDADGMDDTVGTLSRAGVAAEAAEDFYKVRSAVQPVPLKEEEPTHHCWSDITGGSACGVEAAGDLIHHDQESVTCDKCLGLRPVPEKTLREEIAAAFGVRTTELHHDVAADVVAERFDRKIEEMSTALADETSCDNPSCRHGVSAARFIFLGAEK